MGIYFCLGATSFLVPETLNFKVLKHDIQLPTVMGVQPNISLSSCPYWYATLNSCRYLKSETHRWNTQVNQTSLVKGIVKTCLDVGIVRNNCSRIIVAGCGLHYFILARFGSYWVANNFSTAERFKCLFFTAMKIHTMVLAVRKALFLVH